MLILNIYFCIGSCIFLGRYGSNIGTLMFILVENKISYNLVYEYFNKSFTCDWKIILNFLQKNFWPFLGESLAAPYLAF